MEIEQMSLIEVALMLMEKKRTPQNIRKLIKEVLEVKGKSEDDFDSMTQLYLDITTCADFVYCGDDNWDLKDRQPIEFWERDGSSFNQGIEEDEDEDDGLTVDDYSLDSNSKNDLDEEDEDLDEEDEDLEDQTHLDLEDEDLSDDDDMLDLEDDELVIDAESLEDEDYMDEDKYNEIMDDYEDMYDE